MRRRGEGIRGRPAPGANVDVMGVGVEDRLSMDEDGAWRGGEDADGGCDSRGVYSGTLSFVGIVEWYDGASEM